MITNNIEITTLRSLFFYDEASGTLRWNAYRNIAAGALAGSLDSQGYRRVRLFKKWHATHRIVWALATGAYPSGVIDHIDGCRENNRISNLRDVSKLTNAENQRNARHHSKSGFLGVSPAFGRWKAQLESRGVKLYLGLFDTREAAHAAYVAAKREVHEGNTL